MFKNLSRHNLSLKKPSLLLGQAKPCFTYIDENFFEDSNLVNNFQPKKIFQDLNLFNNNPGPWGPWGSNDSKSP